MTRPATGEGSRRRERYEAQGIDLTPPDDVKEADEAKELTDAEAQRAREAQYEGLNRGIPTHRGANQEVYDAVTRGLQSAEPEGTPEERARERGLTGTNHGIPEHRGFTQEDKARLEAAAKEELEVE